MTRKETSRSFEQIRNEGEAAAGALRSLIRDCEQAVAAGSAEPPWRVQAAEVFVELLRQEAAASLPEGAAPESRESLDEALLQGPAGLEALRSSLESRIRDSEKPRLELELLRARRRCQELRLRCLDHLDAIFHAQRTQP